MEEPRRGSESAAVDYEPDELEAEAAAANFFQHADVGEVGNGVRSETARAKPI